MRAARVAHARQVVRRLSHEVLRLAATRAAATRAAATRAATRAAATRAAARAAAAAPRAAAAFARGERRTEHLLVACDGEVVEA